MTPHVCRKARGWQHIKYCMSVIFDTKLRYSSGTPGATMIFDQMQNTIGTTFIIFLRDFVNLYN